MFHKIIGKLSPPPTKKRKSGEKIRLKFRKIKNHKIAYKKCYSIISPQIEQFKYIKNEKRLTKHQPVIYIVMRKDILWYFFTWKFLEKNIFI